MKVVHIIKRIEMIDNDIKELRKVEKSIKRDKSFSTPIIMTIEKQINILLGERVKLLDLKIDNPPADLVESVVGKQEDEHEEPTRAPKAKKKSLRREFNDDDEMPMLTQDDIDSKFTKMQEEEGSYDNAVEVEEEPKPKPKAKSSSNDAEKLLDLALSNGTLSSKEPQKERKVKFFRDNFPIK